MTSKLYILPFDHRGSFAKMFGFDAASLTPEATEKLRDLKHVVYEGFLKSLEMGILKEAGAILVDERLGTKIQDEARAAGITRLLTVEKSSQDEFDFEYGSDFGEHIDRFKPEYVKVLVRYNSQGDHELNMRQLQKLKILNDFCYERGYKFLVELLAAATESQLQEAGSKEAYDKKMRYQIMHDSVSEFQANGVEPHIWKLEGLDDTEQMRQVVEAARSGNRLETGVIVLGRDETDERVTGWLKAAAPIPGVVGMAVGRTIFKEPLIKFNAGGSSREEAADAIASNFKKFVDVFEAARAVTLSPQND